MRNNNNNNQARFSPQHQHLYMRPPIPQIQIHHGQPPQFMMMPGQHIMNPEMLTNNQHPNMQHHYQPRIGMQTYAAGIHHQPSPSDPHIHHQNIFLQQQQSQHQQQQHHQQQQQQNMLVQQQQQQNMLVQQNQILQAMQRHQQQQQQSGLLQPPANMIIPASFSQPGMILSSTSTPNSHIFFPNANILQTPNSPSLADSTTNIQDHQQNIDHTSNKFRSAESIEPSLSATVEASTSSVPRNTDLSDSPHEPSDETVSEAGFKPSAPYYELPAGLMVPLVGLADREYKPLDPEDLRLPPPTIPSEKLLKAVEEFYAPQLATSKIDYKGRDNDGWNRQFIDEYIKKKGQAMVQAMLAR